MKPALSAGRVQSVAVRLIVEREREIQAFQSEASYRVTAVFLVPDADGKPVEMKAELSRRIKTKAEAQKFLESCRSASFTIHDISTRPLKKSPAAPFTTSTLQQEAARKLGFTVAQTMMVAQRLYESGKITYMRTDSVNLSELAVDSSKAVIADMMGERYVYPRHFATKTKGAQEAHEAIRPTYMENAKIEGTPQERKLYDLIWKRTIASQMADAEVEKTTVSIGISNEADTFNATGEVVKFDGFLHVYRESIDEDTEQEDETRLLPPLKKGQVLHHQSIMLRNASRNIRPVTPKPALYANWKNWVSAVLPHTPLPFNHTATRLCGERRKERGRALLQHTFIAGQQDYGRYANRNYRSRKSQIDAYRYRYGSQ